MNNVRKYQVNIVGITPLIMHSDRACNPLSSISKKIKEITSIRKKTDEHHLALSRIEFEAGLYINDELGIYMPAKCLQGTMKSAAKKFKKGKLTKAIILSEPVGYPIPELVGMTPESLYNTVNKSGDHPYVFIESLVVSQSRIMRTRPLFSKWSVMFHLYLDEELMPVEDLKIILETAGNEFGLCELRPGLATGNYGKFKLDSLKEVK